MSRSCCSRLNWAIFAIVYEVKFHSKRHRAEKLHSAPTPISILSSNHRNWFLQLLKLHGRLDPSKLYAPNSRKTVFICPTSAVGSLRPVSAKLGRSFVWTRLRTVRNSPPCRGDGAPPRGARGPPLTTPIRPPGRGTLGRIVARNPSRVRCAHKMRGSIKVRRRNAHLIDFIHKTVKSGATGQFGFGIGSSFKTQTDAKKNSP